MSRSSVSSSLLSATERASRSAALGSVVAPGFIQTDMVDAMNPKIVDGVKSMIPMRRLGDPAEVARVVRFLCSDDATYVTGQQWVVDGGLS